MFFRLLLESFRRQRRRKLLAGTAILLGTTAVTAMLALATTIGDRIHRELAVYGANIIVTPQAADLAVKLGDQELKPANGNAYLDERDLDKLRGIFWANNITGISPELHQRLFFSQQDRTAGYESLALWFDHPFGQIRTGAAQMHSWWKLQGRWPSSPDQVVLGRALADHLKIAPGQVITLGADDPALQAAPKEAQQPQRSPRTFTVTGIVSSGDATDEQILLPLTTAQELAGSPNAIDRVEVSARTRPEDAFARKDPDTLSPKQRDLWYCRPYANSIAYQIHEAIPNARAEQVRRVEQSEGGILTRISGLMWLISAAALIAAAFAVSAAMATAILERRREIGLMRSLGASRASIALLFYVEGAILAVVAGAFGYLAGSLLSAWLGARIFDTGASAAGSAMSSAPVNLVLLPIILALALLVAVAGSTPSIRSALRTDPSEVLRGDA